MKAIETLLGLFLVAIVLLMQILPLALAIALGIWIVRSCSRGD